jgi:hypothetical protein
MSKERLSIAELVDLSPPLMAEEGKGFTESTNYSTISMKHTNGQLTIIDVVVVQAMSRNSMLYLAPSVQHIAQLGIVEFTNTELKELKSYACHSCLCAVQNKIQPLNSKTPLEHNSARPA